MLTFGQLYYISGRDEEMYYKYTSYNAVLKQDFNTIYMDYSNHCIGEIYNGYTCIDIDIFHKFVYDIEDLESQHISCYIKDISKIIFIENFN